MPSSMAPKPNALRIGVMRKPLLNGFHLDVSCVTRVEVPAARGKSYLFRGDKSADNGDNLRRFFLLEIVLG
jgi:hypothetical protein